MPRSCSICTHAQTAEIAKAIAAGGSNRSMADRFSVTPSAIQRHRTGCLRLPRRATKLAADSAHVSTSGSPRFDSADPKSLISTTARLVDEALDLLAHAKREDDRRTALVALREARDGLALLMRIAGMLAGDGATIAIDARRQTMVLSELTVDELRGLARLAPSGDDVVKALPAPRA